MFHQLRWILTKINEKRDADELPTLPSAVYYVVGSLFGDDGEPGWVAQQPKAFRDLLARIEACPSLPELAGLGKQIYRMQLTHEQAGMA